MGEAKMKRENALAKLIPCSSLQTAGGRVQVRWESESAATPMGQLAYFIEFLTLTGLWQRWKESYEYALLVTNLDHDILALGQLYRDRADAGNAFDELKNQWGWGGFTTHDLRRCQLSARAVALIYNWWSLFVRLANPEARREAITSRPWLMSSVGRRTEHAGQTTISLTGLHAEFAKARAALTRVSAMLHDWAARAAEQLNPAAVWHLVCAHLKRVLAGIAPPKTRRSLEQLEFAEWLTAVFRMKQPWPH